MTRSRVDRPADVLIVGTARPTIGGIAAVIEDHARGLGAAGLSVRIVNTGERRRQAPGIASISNVFAALRDARRVLRAVRVGRPRVVAIHTVGSPLLPLGRTLALVAASCVAGPRPVVHLHGYDIGTALSSRRFVAAVRALRLARTVVVLDEPTAELLRAAGAARATRVLANGVDTRVYSPGDRAQPPRAVFVGTVGTRKGVDVLLQAMRLVDGLTCDIVGGPAEEGVEVYGEVIAAARPLVDAGRVVLHGETDRENVLPLLRAASIFVLPSRAEGMPVALLEAMACGVAVVVSDVGAMPRLVEDAGCGVVVPAGDLAALASALTRLANDAALCEQMGAAGRRHIEQHHDSERLVADLLGIYGEAAGGALTPR